MGNIYLKPRRKEQTRIIKIVKIPPERISPEKIMAARKIQAWWRGVLVRRVLLVAALRAWMIQSWWRTVLHRRACSCRQALLQMYAVQETAAVKLQACVRMWLCRQYFCQLCRALYVFQNANGRLFLQKDDSWPAQHNEEARQPEFHIEIVCVLYSVVKKVVPEKKPIQKMKKEKRSLPPHPRSAGATEISLLQRNGRQERNAAIQIQAWWRGTLVRRALLHAALQAWVIQCWWRLTLLRLLEKKRREVLVHYANQERAVVKLQSLVRMWRIHWRYCQVLNAIYIIQGHWECHNCQTCSFLRAHCVITTTHLQFHIEIINN
ncbi:IQ domain-containing protein F2 [Thomomys bottae]